jgi:hypothetical protein
MVRPVERVPRWLIAVLAFFVGGLVFPVASSLIVSAFDRESEPPIRTEISFFDPMLPTEEPLEISATLKGSCLPFSVVNRASEAIRCFADNGIYDPCWAVAYGAGGHVCLSTPWDETGVRVTGFVAPWPKGYRPESGRSPTTRTVAPWALQLSNGRRCLFVSGATYAIAGQRLNYRCLRAGDGKDFVQAGPDGYVEWIVGVPDRSVQPWVVRFMQRNRATVDVPVLRAWY